MERKVKSYGSHINWRKTKIPAAIKENVFSLTMISLVAATDEESHQPHTHSTQHTPQSTETHGFLFWCRQPSYRSWPVLSTSLSKSMTLQVDDFFTDTECSISLHGCLLNEQPLFMLRNRYQCICSETDTNVISCFKIYNSPSHGVFHFPWFSCIFFTLGLRKCLSCTISHQRGLWAL